MALSPYRQVANQRGGFASAGMGLQSFGAALQGREYGGFDKFKAQQESDARKATLSGLMGDMGISGPRCALIDMMLQPQAISWLMGEQDSRAAASASAAQYQRDAEAEAATQAQFASMMGGGNVAPQQDAWNAAVSAPIAQPTMGGIPDTSTVIESILASQGPQNMGPPEMAVSPSGDMATIFQGNPMGVPVPQPSGVQNLADITEVQQGVQMPPQEMTTPPMGDIGPMPTEDPNMGDEGLLGLMNLAADPNLGKGQKRYIDMLIEQRQEEMGGGFRMATPEEAAERGAIGGQFGPDGRFYPSKVPSGMEITVGEDGQFTFRQGEGVASGDGGMNKGETSGTSAVKKDYLREELDDGTFVDTLIEGTPTWNKLLEKSARSRAGLSDYYEANAILTEDTQRAIDLIENATFPITGMGSVVGALPGTKAHQLGLLLTTLTSAVALGRLAALKATGATMGALNTKEGEWLSASSGSLEQSNGKEALLFNLRRLMELRKGAVLRMENAYDDDFGELGDSKPAYTGEGVYDPAKAAKEINDKTRQDAVDYWERIK